MFLAFAAVPIVVIEVFPLTPATTALMSYPAFTSNEPTVKPAFNPDAVSVKP